MPGRFESTSATYAFQHHISARQSRASPPTWRLRCRARRSKTEVALFVSMRTTCPEPRHVSCVITNNEAVSDYVGHWLHRAQVFSPHRSNRFGENMFEGPVADNIPEVLNNGEVTDGTHVTVGQLAQSWPLVAGGPPRTDRWLRTEAASPRCRACTQLQHHGGHERLHRLGQRHAGHSGGRLKTWWTSTP